MNAFVDNRPYVVLGIASVLVGVGIWIGKGSSFKDLWNIWIA